jgi:phosphoglycerol transferase MdoB-like AlkP superfamily enzyme
MDPENNILDLNNIDNNYDYESKLINPYKVYLNEDNEKLKKKAMEQILGNAMSLENEIETTNKSKIEKEKENTLISESVSENGFKKNISGNISSYLLDNHLISRYNSIIPRENLNFDNFEEKIF